jgi:DNA-binding NarL/FixJ family response regulator
MFESEGGALVGVYLITECGAYREALEGALARTGRVTVVGSARRPFAALAELVSLAPQVALVDVPGPDGPACVRVLTTRVPRLRVIVMGLAEVEAEIIAWAEAGVSAYIGCDASLDDVVAAIEGVVRGEAVCPARTTSVLLRRIASGSRAPAPAWARERDLTPREHEILSLVGEGLSNQQIARRLCIALPTVKNHIHNLLEKLGVHTRMEALRAVRRAGFVRERVDVPAPAGDGVARRGSADWISDGSFDPLKPAPVEARIGAMRNRTKAERSREGLGRSDV